jgi:hypothetical protein
LPGSAKYPLWCPWTKIMDYQEKKSTGKGS